MRRLQIWHREENNSNGSNIDMTFPLIMMIIQFFILYFIHIKSNQIITRTLSHLSCYSFNPNIISSDFSKLGWIQIDRIKLRFYYSIEGRLALSSHSKLKSLESNSIYSLWEPTRVTIYSQIRSRIYINNWRLARRGSLELAPPSKEIVKNGQ